MLNLHDPNENFSLEKLAPSSPAGQAQPSAPEEPVAKPKPKFHMVMPVIVSTDEPFELPSDQSPQSILHLLVERMKLNISMSLPNGDEIEMSGQPALVEKSPQGEIHIPVALTVKLPDGETVPPGKLGQTVRSMVDLLNQYLAEKPGGCVLNLLEPKLCTAAPKSLPDPI